MKAKYERKGHDIDDSVEVALKNIRINQKYRRPPAHSDQLYEADAVHPPQKSNEGCLSACHSSLAIPRRDRDNEKELDPAIHYGVIASGNKLMKDALVRDKLLGERDVLCFEMEAAGLMNHFPCLVVRGICDYSDSHKNKEWQGFAAMVAAAYAKDLLRIIQVSKVEAAPRLISLVSGMSK